MKVFKNALFLIILLFLSSCTYLNFTQISTEEKGKTANKNRSDSLSCPDHYIPKKSGVLLTNKGQKILKLHSVKIDCELVRKNDVNKVLIKQTIYYQVLKPEIEFNTKKTKLYIGLINEDKKQVKFKILYNIKRTPIIKANDKVYFKNISSFLINPYSQQENVVFYYGFQK